MTFTECRLAWRKDWLAMKAGTYEAPLPHPCMFVDDQTLTRGQRIQGGRRRAQLFRDGYGKTE